MCSCLVPSTSGREEHQTSETRSLKEKKGSLEWSSARFAVAGKRKKRLPQEKWREGSSERSLLLNGGILFWLIKNAFLRGKENEISSSTRSRIPWEESIYGGGCEKTPPYKEFKCVENGQDGRRSRRGKKLRGGCGEGKIGLSLVHSSFLSSFEAEEREQGVERTGENENDERNGVRDQEELVRKKGERAKKGKEYSRGEGLQRRRRGRITRQSYPKLMRGEKMKPRKGRIQNAQGRNDPAWQQTQSTLRTAWPWIAAVRKRRGSE